MKRLALFLALLPACAIAQSTGAINGYCNLGGTSATVSGMSSTNKLQGIIPHCTVTVYLTGTTTKPTHIYSDANNTILANPFTANAKSSPNAGAWLFFSTINQAVDVVMSGGDPPLTYPSPVTITDVFPGMVTPGVTAITPGTNVTCSSLVAGVCAGNVTINAPTSQFTLFDHNGTPLPTQTLVNFLDATPGLPATGVSNIFLNDGAGGIGSYTPYSTSSTKGANQPDNTSITVNNGVYSANTGAGVTPYFAPPVAGQYVVILPNSKVSVPNPVAGAMHIAPGGSTPTPWAEGYYSDTYCSLGSGGYQTTFTGLGAGLAALGIPTANVTAVYAFANAVDLPGQVERVCGPIGSYLAGPTILGVGVTASATGVSNVTLSPVVGSSQYNIGQLVGITAGNLASASFVGGASVGGSGVPGAGAGIGVGWIVYYTGTPVTQPNKINVVSPLTYDAGNSLLGIQTPLDTNGTDTGAANAYAVSVPWLKPTTNTTVKFLPAHNCTSAAPTLSLNGSEAFTIVGPTGLPLASGDCNTSVPASVIFGTGFHWYLQNPQVSQPTSGSGASQTVVASATTIAPTNRFFHVSGITTISTITAPAFCVVSGTMCQITMIPDGLWATTTGGNISIGTTAVVNKALVMTYDPATTSWFPSY
jgi:hypothetical protein